jgi:hypothetical protein
MLKSVFSVIAVVSLSMLATCASGDAPSTTKTFSIVQPGRDEALRKAMAELVDQILVQKVTAERDWSRLETGLELVVEKKAGKGLPNERAEAVREFLGADRYKKFENFLINQLSSRDSSVSSGAARELGVLLYSADSETELKHAIFRDDASVRIAALTSLVALRTQGAWQLLQQALLSRTMDDLTASEVVDVFYSTDKKRLSEGVPRILNACDGPFVTKALLPAMRLRKDFSDTVARLFLSDRGRVPNTEELTLEQHGRLELEAELLFEIEVNPEPYLRDPAVKRKVEAYAKSKDHSELYRSALLALERAGREQSYFEEMAKDTANPQEKTACLNQIIDSIKNGKRLKPDPLEAAKDE